MESRAEKNELIIKKRFKVLRELGHGGMGEIYLAEDVKLKRKVAIKRISAKNILDSSAKTRFLREAQTASQLEHPNICTIYEIYEEDENDYIVMQYVDGVTLNQIMELKKLSVDKILDIGIQVCRGMGDATVKGIIHRDLKPGNIMVDRRGVVKLLDFGLAKIKDKAVAREKGLAETNWTEKGFVMGTVSYMSPEQVRGQPLDARTDVFSVGCVLYEMLEGIDPFHDKDHIAVLYNILNKEIGFSLEIPEDLKEAVLKCLKKDKEQRFADFSDLKEALEECRRQYDGGEGESEANRLVQEASRATDREELCEIVDRVKKLKGTTDPFYSTQKRKVGFFLLPLILFLVGAVVFVLLKKRVEDISIVRPVQKFYIYLHPFENNTEEEGLSRMVGYLLFESLNQFDRFKAINQEAAPFIANGEDEDVKGNVGHYLKKFEIKYHLKGSISRIRDIINIDAELLPVDKTAKRHSITVPGISGKDSLLIHQIDTLTKIVYRKLFPHEEDEVESKKISGIYGTSWGQFLLFYQGLTFFKKLEHPQAESYFLKVRELLISKLYLADLYFFTGSRINATQFIDEVIPELDRLTRSLRLKALATRARLNFNFKEEIQYLRELKDEFGFSKEAFFELAEAYFHHGNARAAVPYYEQAIELYPRYSQAINHLGYCYSYLGNHQKALELFERYRDLDRSANSFDSLGDGYFYAGDFTSAEACKRVVIAMEGEVPNWTYRSLANIYMLKAEFKKADEFTKKHDEVVSDRRSRAFLFSRRAFIHYMNRRFEKALEMVDRSLEVFDDDKLNYSSASAHWLKGLILLSLNRIGDSKNELEWLRKFNEKYRLSSENFSRAYKYFMHLKALILGREGDLRRADEAFKSLLLLKTQLSYRTTFYNYQFFHTGYAGFLMGNKKYKIALGEIDRCLEFNQNYPPALWLKAEILERLEDPVRFSIYKKIAEIYGKSDEENYFRRLLKTKMGQG